MRVLGVTNCFLHVRGSLHGWGGQSLRGKISVVVLLNKPIVKLPSDICAFTHILILLSASVRKHLFFSKCLLMQRFATDPSVEMK